MTAALRVVPAIDDTPEIPTAWAGTRDAWLRNVKARDVAVPTLKSYAFSIGRLIDWCVDVDVDAVTPHPIVDPEDLTTADLEVFQAWALNRNTRYGRKASPASVVQLHRNLRVFFRWLARTDGIPNPFDAVAMPKAARKPVDVMTVDDLRAILAVCEGKSFADRRDYAIVRVLFDCGVRAAELGSMTLEGLDLDGRTMRGIPNVAVMGKGSKPRAVPMGAKTAEAVGLYLRARAKHRDAADPALWLCTNVQTRHEGALGREGVRWMLKRRAEQAGVTNVYPHRFRHTAADMFLAAPETSDGDAMSRFGWETRSMVDHYGRSAKDRRAQEAFRKASPADKV